MTQDRFKFRAWDKINKRMWHVACPNFILEECIVGYSKDEYGKYTHKIDHQNLEIMQCTGLKDKSGVLIYEGDIVCFSFDACQVVNKEYAMKTIVENAVVRWVEEGGFYPFCCIVQESSDLVSPENCEIIGNIYEHPELLKGNS